MMRSCNQIYSKSKIVQAQIFVYFGHYLFLWRGTSKNFYKRFSFLKGVKDQVGEFWAHNGNWLGG